MSVPAALVTLLIVWVAFFCGAAYLGHWATLRSLRRARQREFRQRMERALQDLERS